VSYDPRFEYAVRVRVPHKARTILVASPDIHVCRP
jgi:hypothetical protein